MSFLIANESSSDSVFIVERKLFVNISLSSVPFRYYLMKVLRIRAGVRVDPLVYEIGVAVNSLFQEK